MVSGSGGDQVALRQDLFDLSAFLLATGLRIGEALAVLWREIDLDLGVLHVTSTLIRVTGQGLMRKRTKSQAGERVLQLPEWCVILMDKRREVGASADEPVFGTVNGTFRDPRTVTRWLVEARERHGFEEWMTFHAWRKTTATVLDEAGATARMSADQLGHSRVSMTEDVYLGRRSRESRVAAVLEVVIPGLRAKVWGNLWGRGRARRREAVFALVRELARGLEPLTCCLQDSCATDCATPARRLFALVGGLLAAQDETRIRRRLPWMYALCVQSGWRRRPRPSGRWYRQGVRTRQR